MKTDNSGSGTQEDPKCETVWNSGGENLQSKYGGSNVNEVADDKPMVKSGTIGGCSRCGGVSGVTFKYYYMDIDHGETDDNEVIRLAIEDTIDADGNGVRRTIWGINDEGRNLRDVRITDPDGTPQILVPVVEDEYQHRRPAISAG